MVSWFQENQAYMFLVMVVTVLFYYRKSYSVYYDTCLQWNADPEKRSKGHFGVIGILVMLGSTICGAIQQLGWTPRGFKFYKS